ncbi:uncharacterized protein [Triticum aestivum]|uniref:uncharacterized protein isoform X3 n=1 Tax=Triticum aestivum TaxID=4565 RepID=UPI001D016EA8|nr:uncharacterized protein LOC123186302 isoform X3 [Triticum aestivum]
MVREPTSSTEAGARGSGSSMEGVLLVGKLASYYKQLDRLLYEYSFLLVAASDCLLRRVGNQQLMSLTAKGWRKQDVLYYHVMEMQIGVVVATMMQIQMIPKNLGKELKIITCMILGTMHGRIMGVLIVCTAA